MDGSNGGSPGRSIVPDTIKERGLWYASEVYARLPEKLARRIAQSQIRRGNRFEEGEEFLLHALKVVSRRWKSLHPNARRRFVQNAFGYYLIHGPEKNRVADALFDGEYPQVMVVSPTMRCNLTCEGCYSAHYDRRDAISTERLHTLLDEAKQLGINFIVVSGGEPYLRKDLLEVFETHSSMQFLTYTNGTIIADRGLAPKLAELGNVMPCISVEGFEKETEARRGKGVFGKIVRAMREMKDAGVIFGFSATPMRHNNDLLLTDEFVEFYMNLGCLVGWYFSYLPIGRAPNVDLMPTPAQRLHRYHRIRALRAKYDIMIADFWCDGLLTGGCLSGGRTYFHVNASGGVEPCVFNQFHVDSILDKSLEECLTSAYMRDVRVSLNDVENPLRPCPVCDNPWLQRRWVAEHGAKPSQPGADDVLKGEVAAFLDQYATELKEIFDPIFEQTRSGCPWPLHPERAPNPANAPPSRQPGASEPEPERPSVSAAK
jgi:MoaA/NifB/PqqE/SkfB family radical SAM enzyme